MTRLAGFALSFCSIWAMGALFSFGPGPLRELPFGLGFPIIMGSMLLLLGGFVAGLSFLIAGKGQ